MTGIVKFNSLENNAIDWAVKSYSLYRNSTRESTKNLLIEKGYDINEMSKHFVKLVYD